MNNFTKAAASLTASALFSLAFTACSDSTSANDEIFANISSSSDEIVNPEVSSSSEKGKTKESSSSSEKSNSPKSSSSQKQVSESSSSDSLPQSSSATESSSSQIPESSSSESIKAPSGSFTDARDGKTYKLAKIGPQTWMAEDLSYGDSSLYTFENALDVCPEGFHLPSLKELNALVNFVGGAEVAAQRRLRV